MNCDDCRQRLQACLDGETVKGDDLDAHLLGCPDCRSLHTAARRLQAGLASAVSPVPPAGLADRIVAGVLADRSARRRARRRLVFAVAGLAAAASLAFALLVPIGPPDGPLARLRDGVRGYFAPPPEPVIVEHGPTPPAEPPDEPPPSLAENLEKATSAVASLARRTADQTVSDGQLLVPTVSLQMPPEEVLGPPLDPPAESLREAGHGVATGLEPVASHARRAFDLFLRDIPPVVPETKPGL